VRTKIGWIVFTLFLACMAATVLNAPWYIGAPVAFCFGWFLAELDKRAAK
jgi:hypothetical protein